MCSSTAAQGFTSSSHHQHLCCCRRRIVLHKWTLMQRVLALGFNVLVMDVDYVVLRNPLDILVMSASRLCE